MKGSSIYEISLDLLGLGGDGEAELSDTDDLKARALSLINILIAENHSLDCRITKCEHSLKPIDSLDDEIELNEILLGSVLPYGLAALLMVGEDDSLAASMHKLYEKARTEALRHGRAKAEPITEVYK